MVILAVLSDLHSLNDYDSWEVSIHVIYTWKADRALVERHE